ncbi:MAG: hypothetical protein KTR24_14980 [Saprospiraceae bacterium]|nr:hypothetical protein [Saprospiraceae bacterium]
MKLRRISSSATLGLKLFLPTFWIVFFGAMTIALLFAGSSRAPILGSLTFKLGVLGFFLLGVLLLYFTVIQLKRVELDHEYVYVTNFFKSYRYPLHQIERLVDGDYTLFHLGHFYLKTPGSFGKKITFLQSRQKFVAFMNSSPELIERWSPSSDL